MPPLRPRFAVARQALPALAWLASGAGCLFGGQGTDDDAECRIEERALESDAQRAPALGFAPADVLPWATGRREVSARWHEPVPGTTASSTPGPVDLTVAIERGQGAALEVVPEAWCGEAPSVRVPVEIAIASADGQLDERLAGALTARQTDFATVSADADLSRLHGALEWRSTSSSVGLVQPSVEVALTRAGSAGVLGAIVEMRTADSVSVGPGAGARLLSWPADSPCAPGQVPRAPAEREAIYAEATARAAERTWTDAQGAQYTLAITHEGTLCESGAGGLTLPAAVALRSADGVVDLAFDGYFERAGDELEYHRSAGPSGGSPASFSARFGDFGLALDGHEHVELEFALRLTATGGELELRVVSYRDECATRCDANGCSGCAMGLTPTTLLERSLQPQP